MRKLLEFAEWLRKVSRLLIHPAWQKTRGRETASAAKGLPSQWNLEPFCGSGPTNIIYCEWIPCLGFPPPKQKTLYFIIPSFRMMKWNWHLRGDGASTEAMIFQPNLLLLFSSLAQKGQPTHHHSLSDCTGQTPGSCLWHFCCSPSISHLVWLILPLNIYPPFPWPKSNWPLSLTYYNVLILQLFWYPLLCSADASQHNFSCHLVSTLLSIIYIQENVLI